MIILDHRRFRQGELWIWLLSRKTSSIWDCYEKDVFSVFSRYLDSIMEEAINFRSQIQYLTTFGTSESFLASKARLYCFNRKKCLFLFSPHRTKEINLKILISCTLIKRLKIFFLNTKTVTTFNFRCHTMRISWGTHFLFWNNKVQHQKI